LRQFQVLCLALLLSGCVSERHFVRDSWPFGNPNAPRINSEMAQRALGRVAIVTPIVPQAGDVWPGPVQPFPTLSDMQNKMNQPLGTGYTPSLPSPYPPGQAPDVLPEGTLPELPATPASPATAPLGQFSSPVPAGVK
jgi:hypothetical protein